MSDKKSLIIDGPPRCGNTLLGEASKLYWENSVEILKFDHNKSTILREDLKQIPYVFPVREPVYSIASSIYFSQIYHGRSPSASNVITSYIGLLDAAVSNSERLLIYPFSEISRDIGGAVSDIEKYFPSLGSGKIPEIDLADLINYKKFKHHYPQRRSSKYTEVISKVLSEELKSEINKANDLYLKSLKISYDQLNSIGV
jgi:hypothetical protein